MPEPLDHKLLAEFLGAVLDRYKDDKLTRNGAIGLVDHLFAALETPNWMGSKPDNYMKKVIASHGGDDAPRP